MQNLTKFNFSLQGLLNEAAAGFKDLSPAEQRQKQAEMRAAWRQARLKSLEQVRNSYFALCIKSLVICRI
jgi:hypothetical protein